MNKFAPVTCTLCPRLCGARRASGMRGMCGAADKLMVARSALHSWEEPILSGKRGSGTIFFSHCSLRCSYCQNEALAAGEAGAEISVQGLADACLNLQTQGALNVNFVTPTHYAPWVQAAVMLARNEGLVVPVVWNTSGYERVELLRSLDTTVDVYLSDFKYIDELLAQRYSHAPDYPQVAIAALDEMVTRVGAPCYDQVDGMPRLLRGVVVRHLVLPGALEHSKRVVTFLHERYEDRILLSLMNQYTPVLVSAAATGKQEAARVLQSCPELGRRVSSREYECLLDYVDHLGVEDYFWQDGETATASFIPPFDLTGVIPHDAGFDSDKFCL